ncbi:MAG: class I SAM-dependent RNA methyltransferase [Clostridia bacterium]
MDYFSSDLKLCASVQSGLEAVLKREMISNGFFCEGAINGRIPFKGKLTEVARANMFLRTASRVFVILGSFKADTFDTLYEEISEIPWEDILPPGQGITVLAKVLKSTLMSPSSIQSVTKKSIAARIKQKRNLSRLPETENNLVIEVSINQDIATVFLDTSGDSLHKRGYRLLVGRAPLRETLAAGIILLSYWKEDRVLLDPFTGSGTIPIEAALIGNDIAPGILRNFAYENLPGGKEICKNIRDEAKGRIKENQLRIFGYDIDPKAVGLAVKHAESAGVSKYIHFQKADMRSFSSRFAHGIIITNPPYGERLNDVDIASLYRDFFKMYTSLDSWSAYVLSSFRDTEKSFGKRADKIRKLYNSEIECNLFQYFGPPPKKEEPKDIESN